MPTLHIEHAVVDFDLWKTAFDRFADIREQYGVRGHRIQRPIDDANYVLIELDFDSVRKAEGFLDFLRNQVWSLPQNAPALRGTPLARILEHSPSG